MKFFLSLFCIVGTLITACSKSDSGQKSNNGPTAVKITILSIDTGIYGATVKIIGSGFSATAANDQVFFNGTAATITAANSQELTTLVPLRAGTGKVTVSVNGGTAVVGPVFKYIPSPVVSTFAGSGAQGSTDGRR